MRIWFDANTKAFCCEAVHGEPPLNAHLISAELHGELLAAQSAGKRIEAGPDGAPVAIEPPAPGIEALRDAVKRRVQQFLDAVAREHGYSSMQSAVSYADEPAVPAFQADGLHLRAYRSRVWAAALAVINDENLPPSVDAVLQVLPRLEPWA